MWALVPLSVGLFAQGAFGLDCMGCVLSKSHSVWACSVTVGGCEWTVCQWGCLSPWGPIVSAPSVVPGPVRGRPGELPSWNLSSLSLPGPRQQFHGQVKGEKTSQPPPKSARWGEAAGPHGQGRAQGRVDVHKLCFGSWLLTNAFSGGCPSRGGEPPKKGFKSSPL